MTIGVPAERIEAEVNKRRCHNTNEKHSLN